jgi:hypothetical protein
MPDNAEFEELLYQYEALGDRLAEMAQDLAVRRVAEVLPGASTLEVTGSLNEDWLRVLRINRVLDDDGHVLFGVPTGAADPAVDDVIDEVDTEYLDLLIDLTGDGFLGRHEIGAIPGST